MGIEVEGTGARRGNDKKPLGEKELTKTVIFINDCFDTSFRKK